MCLYFLFKSRKDETGFNQSGLFVAEEEAQADVHSHTCHEEIMTRRGRDGERESPGFQTQNERKNKRDGESNLMS